MNIVRIYIITTSFVFFLDIDEYDSCPCQQGSTCTDRVNRFTCTCASGYEGTMCGTGTSHVHVS